MSNQTKRTNQCLKLFKCSYCDTDLLLDYQVNPSVTYYGRKVAQVFGLYVPLKIHSSEHEMASFASDSYPGNCDDVEVDNLDAVVVDTSQPEFGLE